MYNEKEKILNLRKLRIREVSILKGWKSGFLKKEGKPIRNEYYRKSKIKINIDVILNHLKIKPPVF